MKKEKEVNNKLAIILGVVVLFLFIIMVTIGWAIGSYNTFITADQDLENQFSNIKTEYQRG